MHFYTTLSFYLKIENVECATYLGTGGVVKEVAVIHDV